MDAYPQDYVAHNLPLILLSGLGSENLSDDAANTYDSSRGSPTLVKSPAGINPVTSERGEALLKEFLAADAQKSAWNSGARNGKGGMVCVRLKAVSREFTLPPRKANPPEIDELASPEGSSSSSIPWILHSPISPLSPGSPLYPDGVMTPTWLAKHQHQAPAVFVSFFEFSSSDSSSNGALDKSIISEINGVRSALVDYKTRYAVVLLSEKTVAQASEIDERLANIRRATGLDSKSSIFFMPPGTSRNEMSTFVQTVLLTLQPVCVDYYRDLTKLARRKKGRGSVPPPTAPPTQGTSRTLSNQGWGVRYDFKLGVFAEFRQEMDAAGRHYNIALDSLLGPDGIFETLPSWSPRWDATRMLGDIIALRLIRCLLWNNSPTSAVQAWSSYRKRIQQLLDRKGKGTSNYGWAAWESRWASVMAEVVERANLPIFAISEPIRGSNAPQSRPNALFSLPEKAFAVGERLQPWHHLHHPGYWLKLAAQHAERRRDFAEDIPEEDRTAPGQSPANKVANRYGSYDLYLVPEPHIEFPLTDTKGYDHCNDITELLNQATSHFFARGQQRIVDQLNLDSGRALLHANRCSDALSVLKPLWEGMEWRREGWWNLASAAIWALNESAFQCQEAELLISTEWELSSRTLPGRKDRTHDFMKCLDPISSAFHGIEKMHVTLSSVQAISPVNTHFAFSAVEGNVGEPLPAQIVLVSQARKGSKPITLSKITISFKGCISEIVLKHAATEARKTDSTADNVSMQETPHSKEGQTLTSRWDGEADLTIHPGQIKVFNFLVCFRDAGDVSVVSTALDVDAEQFTLTYTSSPEESHTPPVWWLKTGNTIKPKQASREIGTWTHVLPKPPKMDIGLSNLRTQYYTDEPITLAIELSNKEDEETEAVLELRLLSGSKAALGFSWLSKDGSVLSRSNSGEDSNSAPVDLPGHQVGRIKVGEQRTESIQIEAPGEPSSYAMEIKVLYHLISDRDTPISKILTAELIFATPFEASYDFIPRLHPDPWPSYFDPSSASSVSTAETPTGLSHRWLLRSRIASFADEPLEIIDTNLLTHHIHGGSTLTTTKEFDTTAPVEILPQAMTTRQFNLTTRKYHLDERRSASLELSMAITWRRPNTPPSPGITTTLPIPRLPVPSSEPRVLASLAPPLTIPTAATQNNALIPLTYTLENPTPHFLTFALTMEASEAFAFSGPKARTLSIVPMSRRQVVFHLLPIGKGWLEVNLVVEDTYFKKVLKVGAVDEGVWRVRVEKRGVGVWVE